MTELDDDPARYFTSLDRAVLIPVGLLEPSKPPGSQPESIRQATVRMGQAARGEIPKRGPITVETSDGSIFRIIDGNATYGAALESGWHYVPALIRITPSDEQ